MAWRCISPWSFHRSLQRRREMDIFHICQQSSAFWSKNNLRLNARKHWESESRNRNLSAAVLHVKPSRHNSNLYDSRENHHKVEILNYPVSLQYSKRNRDLITINFQKFSLSRAWTLYWLWALRYISLDNKKLLKVLTKLQRNYFWCRLDREIQIWNN